MQDIQSFEGSSFDNRVGSIKANKYHQNKLMRGASQQKDEDGKVKQEESKYDEIMQSIDESQLGFISEDRAKNTSQITRNEIVQSLAAN